MTQVFWRLKGPSVLQASVLLFFSHTAPCHHVLTCVGETLQDIPLNSSLIMVSRDTQDVIICASCLSYSERILQAYIESEQINVGVSQAMESVDMTYSLYMIILI